MVYRCSTSIIAYNYIPIPKNVYNQQFKKSLHYFINTYAYRKTLLVLKI